MQTSDKKESGAPGKTSARAALPWYAGQYKDALLYLMIAIFFVELIVGGVAFFYGLMHAAPLTPGGPPMARFPWLGWAAAAVLAPVGLLLIVHLAGTWVSRTLSRDEAHMAESSGGGSHDSGAEVLPERLQRFYAIIRNAPTVVVLLGILLLGAGLFFVDGALSALIHLGGALTQYIPWIAGSTAALLAVCFLGHRWFIYRRQRMEQEYAYRREVLERTGIVLVDRGCVPLPQNEAQRAALGETRVAGQAALPPVLEAVTVARQENGEDSGTGGAASEADGGPGADSVQGDAKGGAEEDAAQREPLGDVTEK